MIATIYSIFLGFFVYKELTIKGLYESIIEVEFFGQMIAREQIAVKIANMFLSISGNRLILLFSINALLLFLGTFIEALALLILLIPILVPVVVSAGVNPVFFGILVILTLMMGILTPPMGTALFVVSRVGNMPTHKVIKGIIPFFIPLLVTLILITLFPDIVLFLPRLLM